MKKIQIWIQALHCALLALPTTSLESFCAEQSDLLIAPNSPSIQEARNQQYFLGLGLLNTGPIRIYHSNQTLETEKSRSNLPLLEAGLAYHLMEITERSPLLLTGTIGYTAFQAKSLSGSTPSTSTSSRINTFMSSLRLSLYLPPLLKNRVVPTLEGGVLVGMHSQWGANEVSSLSLVSLNPILSMGIQVQLNPRPRLSTYQTGRPFSIPWILYLKWTHLFPMRHQISWMNDCFSLGGGIDL
jgi:hypothetical protein